MSNGFEKFRCVPKIASPEERKRNKKFDFDAHCAATVRDVRKWVGGCRPGSRTLPGIGKNTVTRQEELEKLMLATGT